MIQLKLLLQHLANRHVDFVLIGGIAESLYGFDTATSKLEVLCSPEPANLEHLKQALASIHARPRGKPAHEPHAWKGLPSGWCYRLATDLGSLDVSGEIAGVGAYDHARTDAAWMHLPERDYRVLSLDRLFAARRAARHHP